MWDVTDLNLDLREWGFQPRIRTMFTGKLAFAQVMDFLPLHTFRRCVQRYPSNYPTKTFSHLEMPSFMGRGASLLGLR